MPPPVSAADPYLGFDPSLCYESAHNKHSYGNFASGNSNSKSLLNMDKNQRMHANAENMTFAIAMRIAQQESDEYLFAAADWWMRIHKLFDASADALRKKADAMTEFWDSDGSKSYFEKVGGAVYSMDLWAYTASSNATALRTLGNAVQTYQIEIEKIWREYAAAAGDYTDQVGQPDYRLTGKPSGDVATSSYATRKRDAAEQAEEDAMNKARPWVEKLQNAFANASQNLDFGHAHYQGPKNALPANWGALSDALGKHLARQAARNMPTPPAPPAAPAAPPSAPAAPPTPPTPPTPPAPPAPPVPPAAPQLAGAHAPPALPPTPPTPPAPPAAPAIPNVPTTAPATPSVPPAVPPNALTPPRAPNNAPNQLSGRTAPNPPSTPNPPPGRSPLSGRNSPTPPLPQGRGGKAPTARNLNGRQTPASPHPPMPGMPRTPGSRSGNRPSEVNLPGRGGTKPVNRPAPASFPDNALPPAARPGTSAPANPQLRGRGTTSNSADAANPGRPNPSSTPSTQPAHPATKPAAKMRRTPIIDALAPNTSTTDLGGRPRQPAVEPDTPEIQREALRPGLDGHRYAEPTHPPAAPPAAPNDRQPTYETNESEQEKPWTVAHDAVSIIVTPAEVTPAPDRSALGGESARGSGRDNPAAGS